MTKESIGSDDPVGKNLEGSAKKFSIQRNVTVFYYRLRALCAFLVTSHRRCHSYHYSVPAVEP